MLRDGQQWYDSASRKNGAPLSIVDVDQQRIIKTLLVQVSSSGLALTSDGRFVLATNGFQLTAVDTKTDQVANSLSLRGYGNAIAVRSDDVIIVGGI